MVDTGQTSLLGPGRAGRLHWLPNETCMRSKHSHIVEMLAEFVISLGIETAVNGGEAVSRRDRGTLKYVLMAQ